MVILSTNPSKNYQFIGKVAFSSLEEVRNKVAKARLAKQAWKELGISGRSRCLTQAILHFERDQERLAHLISQEMGMPVQGARDDLVFGLDYFRAYINQASRYLAPEISYETEQEIHEIHREPYGIAAVIIPWNFPFSNFVWQCGQNLVAGNTIVLKHSEETPLFGQAIEEILSQHLPEGVFNEVYGDGTVGQMLINEPVQLICFTGSSKTGLLIHKQAASRFIRTILELGGSAPGIVFEDCELNEPIIQALFNARFANSGQMCDALKRLIVHESKFEELVLKLKAKLLQAQVGDAEKESTTLGPLVSEKQLILLKEQVEDALQKGAKILIGGKQPPHLKGAYYEPTLLSHITKQMRVWKEELFGPVLPIVPFRTEEEAIALANDTSYGLGAYVFTKDPKRFDRVARLLESGMVCQNSLSYVKTCNPFGGYKHSGQSREHAQFGFHEVTQIKIIAKERKKPS